MFARQTEKPPETFYYEVELTPDQHILLLEIVRRVAGPRSKMEPLVEALATARRMDTPLRRAKLDWTMAENESKRRGSSIADWLYDRPKPWKKHLPEMDDDDTTRGGW